MEKSYTKGKPKKKDVKKGKERVYARGESDFLLEQEDKLEDTPESRFYA